MEGGGAPVDEFRGAPVANWRRLSAISKSRRLVTVSVRVPPLPIIALMGAIPLVKITIFIVPLA